MSRKVQRVLLVNACSDSDVSSIANDGTFPSLGVVSLATVLLRDHPGLDVIALDGQVTPMSEVEELIRDFEPQVLGIGVLATSYGNTLRLAEAGKNIGAVTILGNDQAAAMGRQILQHREAVDYVCTADVGEFAMSAFVGALNGERPLTSVPGLLYRTPGGIEQNRLPEIPADEIKARTGGALHSSVLDAVPIPDRTLMPESNWNQYLHNYLQRYGALHDEEITGVTTMNRARGCARVKAPCHFCGIMDLSLRFSSPGVFWDDVRAAQKDVSASIFYEAFDSMSSSPRWVKSLVDAKPDDIQDPKFFVYTQAAETTPRLVGLYRQLGVYRVNMGLESGDTRMLKVLKGPRDSLENNQRACRLFKEAGIPIYGSLVLGGPGENHDSLDNTIAFSRWLIDNEMMASVEAAPLYPDFGALTGQWLMNPNLARQVAKEKGFEILDEELLDSMPAKYGATDMVNFDEVSHDWCKIFSRVTWDELIEVTHTIRSYAERRGTVTGSGRVTHTQLGSL